MPRRSKPGGELPPIVLKCDEDESPQPAFIFAAPTYEQDMELADAYDFASSGEPDSLRAAIEPILVQLDGLLIRWEHMKLDGKAFTYVNLDSLKQLLCVDEVMELGAEVMLQSRLNGEEKKSSE